MEVGDKTAATLHDLKHKCMASMNRVFGAMDARILGAMDALGDSAGTKDAYMHTLQAQAQGIPSLAMAPLECPPGHRLLQPQDLAVGKDVLYISRDPSTPHVHTKILDITIVGDKIKLEHKSEAPMNRIFVTDQAAVGAEAAGPDKAAVGAEATGPDKAADGAVGSAGAAPATLGEAASPGDLDADKFLRNEVVGWMSSLEAVGSSLPEALDAALAMIGKTPEEMVVAFKAKVPWLPCVNFQAVPKFSKKAPCTFRCCHIDRARTQLMACSWEMPSCYWKQRDLLV
jgi:hypothetical protein